MSTNAMTKIPTDAQALAVLDELANEFFGGRPGSINAMRRESIQETRDYLTARLASTSPAPDGLVLVPRVPTEAMIRKATDCQDADPEDGYESELYYAYKAMIAAAPQTARRDMKIESTVTDDERRAGETVLFARINELEAKLADSTAQHKRIVAGLEADAARYRVLREGPKLSALAPCAYRFCQKDAFPEALGWDRLDAAIDAFLAQTAEGSK